MNTHYTYLLILATTFAGPFFLSFDKKVAFYKKWKFLFPAMLIPALLYTTWDIYFTSIGTWSFNKDHVTGINLYNLPLEEVLFFFLVPYCCVFIYECIRTYFPQLKNKRIADRILQAIAIILLLTGIIFYKKDHTSWTFIITAVFITIIYLCRKFFRTFDSASFLISYMIIVVPFLLVNGFLTAIPVVQYNNTENLGLRIYTIPVEDIFYGMLLVLMNISIYEKLLNRK